LAVKVPAAAVPAAVVEVEAQDTSHTSLRLRHRENL
jgi:hypothetical protein